MKAISYMHCTQHARPSGVLCRWSDGLERAAWRPPRPVAQCRHFQERAEDASFSECTWTLSALEALRNALYKFKTYLLTYLLFVFLSRFYDAFITEITMCTRSVKLRCVGWRCWCILLLFIAVFETNVPQMRSWCRCTDRSTAAGWIVSFLFSIPRNPRANVVGSAHFLWCRGRTHTLVIYGQISV